MTNRISHILNANKFKVDLEVIFIQRIIFYDYIVTDRGELAVVKPRSRAVHDGSEWFNAVHILLSLKFSPPSLYPAD